jgi:hypothetical protein
LNAAERAEAQRRQKEEWLASQRAEAAAARAQADEIQRLEEIREREIALRSQQIMAAEDEARREAAATTREYNLAMAEAKAERLAAEKEAEIESSISEMMNTVKSGILAEDPDSARSTLGEGRIRPDGFRGFTQEQLEAIRQEQLAQLEEAKLRKERERELEEVGPALLETLLRCRHCPHTLTRFLLLGTPQGCHGYGKKWGQS